MKVLGGSITLVLLAGGYNERLRRTEKSLPKSLVPLPNVPPVMVLLADQFIRAGARVVVVCDSLAAQMFKLLYPSMALSVKVLEDDFVGTGRALHIAVEAARSRLVLVANADTIVPVDLATWCPSVEIDSPIHQLLVPQSVQNSGLIGVDPCDGQVRHWGETIGRAPAGRLQHASSTGVYLIDRNSWLSWPDARGESLEREVLPEAVSQGLLRGTIAPSGLPVFDYGTIDRLQELQNDDRLRDNLLAAAGLHPKGRQWTPPNYTSGPRDTSDARLWSAASSVAN